MRFQHTPHEGTSLQNALSGRTVIRICVLQKYRILFAADEVYRLDSSTPINPYGWVCESELTRSGQ